MQTGVNYKFFKSDFKELCELYKNEEEEYRKSDKKNSLYYSPKEKFFSILEDYISYVDAVVSHVVYEKDFREYGAGTMSKMEMEYLNRVRINAHNRALKGSIVLFEKNPYMFLLNGIDLNGKKTEKDFSAGERRKMGDFIFRVVTVMASLTDKEMEEFGFECKSNKHRERIDSMERMNNIELKVRDVSGNMPGIDSVYSQEKGER